MAAQDLKYYELTEKIIGCAMRVHRYFGPGFPEIVYKRALMIEFQKLGLAFKQEVEKDIIYENALIYKRRLDLIVENIVLLELKAQKEVDNGDYNQIINYLRVFKMEVSLLLNFGASSLQFKRFVHTIQE
ncbi:MAG TPA: GxxExxY protein [Chitinophagaceae bacterium]|nr:GxxExxY protein [Chitinophagaceae bacterium]